MTSMSPPRFTRSEKEREKQTNKRKGISWYSDGLETYRCWYISHHKFQTSSGAHTAPYFPEAKSIGKWN